MKITSRLSVLVYLFAIFSGAVFAQNDCPGIPSRAKFDTLGYISANIPTDPSNPIGKMYLGQGWAQRGSVLRPGFIPSNKPSWAIGIAVAWNLARNLNQRVEYPNMNYWMATLIQETELRCATGLTWSDPSHVPDAYNAGTVYAAQINNGCLQIEGPGSAWSALQQAYPNGRIPFDNTLYSQLIEGVDGFESSALVKTYYDGYTSQIFNYNVGWDFYNNVDCKRQHDPYAYEKMSASNYNAGPNGFLNNAGIINDVGPGCWSGLAATTAGYGNDIAKWISVLDGNTGYCEYPGGGSAKGPDYNDAVPYSEVTKYLNIIQPMYPDVNFATDLIPHVEAAFTGKAGSLAGTINFSDFGDVIDAIVLHLPMDKPTPVDGSPIGINLGCSGNFLPYGHVDILNGGTNMCLGESVTLELSVDAGNDPNIQFKWFKGDPLSGTLISTDKIVTITPSALGTEVYSGQICNANGCYTVYSNTQNSCQDSRNLNGFNVIARDCNLCPFLATGTSVNAVCKGTPDGSIQLNLVNMPANYEVSYIATTPVGNDTVSFNSSGATVGITGVRDGAYNFILTDLTDPACKAYTTVIVGYDTDINEYIDAELLSVANCVAGVKAEIKELPKPCLWKVVALSTPTYQWEPAVNALVTTSTGKTLLQKHTATLPAPNIYDQWTAAQPSEFYLSLNTGDVISMGTALTTTPGATQWYNYRFQIYDENDVVVYTGNSPLGSSTFGYNHMIGDYTVTCPQTVPDYTIAWSPSISNEVTTTTTSTGDAEVFSATQVYTVTATNNTNPQCVLKDSVIVLGDPTCNTVTVCTKPPYEILTPDTSVCKGDSATIRLSFTGTSPFNLYYTPGSGSQESVTGITTDFYNIRIADAMTLTIDSIADATCTNDTAKSVVLTLDSIPSVYIGADTTLCGSSHTITTIGTNIATYQWQENAANSANTFAVSSTGEYRVEVASADGCIAWDTINVTLNPAPTAIDIPDTGLCLADLPITLDATQAGVTYEWNDNSTNATLSANAAGDYWVIVTQAGCSDTDSVSISLKGAATVNLGNDTTICGTSFIVDAGAGQTTYQWMEDAANNGQTFTAATTGQNEYRVEVSNADGCISRDTINVTLNPKPVFNFSPSDTVFACSSSFPVSLDATTASASYEWSDMSIGSTLNVNAQGDYWVIVTVNGCSGTDSVYVKESSTLSLDLGLDTTVCPGQSITLNPVVNYSNITYTWSDGSNGTSLTTNVAGKIYLDIQDQGGCSGVDTMELFTNNPLTIELGTAPTGLCFGDTADLELTPARTGLNYDWNDGTIQVSTDSVHRVWAEGTTTFTLSVDSAGCTARDDIAVTINSLPTVSLGTDTFVCQGAGATITLDAGAGQANYLWNDNSAGQTLDVGSAGDYDVRITDGNGCIARDTITVTEETATSVALTGGDVTICPAGSAVIALDNTSATATGATWVWTNDNSTNPAATYTVQNQLDGDVVQVEITYTNEFGCVDIETTTVTVSNVLDVQITGNVPMCVGDDIAGGLKTNYHGTVNPNFRDFVYVWNSDPGSTGANFPVNNALIGDDGKQIDVYVTDTVNGCSGSASATLSVNPLPVPVLRDTATCVGTPVTITAQLSEAAHSFEWTKNGVTIASSDFANQIISGLVSGTDTYQVTATVDATGCSASIGAVVSVTSSPNVALGGDAGVACVGEQKVLSTEYQATYNYNWAKDGVALSETSNSLTVSADGTYLVTVVDNLTACSSSESVDVVFTPPPTVDLKVDSLINLCIGSDTTIVYQDFDVSKNYVWSNGVRNTDHIRITEYGVYWLKEIVGGCVDVDTIVVAQRELPSSGLQEDTVVCFDDMYSKSMLLDSKQLDNTYVWNTGDTSQAIRINESGYYEVTIISEFGCKVTDGVTVSQDCKPNIWMPVAFTPNGDGKNDTWGVTGHGIKTVEVQVYNRWGEEIWSGNSLEDFWDGKFNGHPVAQDVYVWRVKYSFEGEDGLDQSRTQVGHLTIFK